MVVLRDVEGLSHREISEVLGITVASAKSRVHRARLFLRKRLAGYMSPGQGGLASGPKPARVGAAVSSDDRSRARCHSRVAQAQGPGDRRLAVVAASTCRGTCPGESGRRAQARGAERGGPYEPVPFRAPLQEERRRQPAAVRDPAADRGSHDLLVLADRQAPIGEVARVVGFRSQSHFTTTFRRVTGVTPGNYGAVEAVAIVGRARNVSGIVLSCQKPTVNVEVE